MATALALAPLSKAILEALARAIPLRWLAVLLYTYLVLLIVRWPLPALFVYLAHRDFRDGLFPELPRGRISKALRLHLIVTALAIPLFALLLGLDFAPWEKTSWNPILYAAFAGVAEVLFFTAGQGGFRPGDEELRQRAEEIGKRMKVKPPRLKYQEVPGRAPGSAVYILLWFWDVIVLSRSLRSQLTPRELDVVLAHELAHRKEN